MVQFYSYDYLISRLTVINWIQLIFVSITIIVLAFFIYRYHQKREVKYRELSIIAMLAVLIIVFSHISKYQNTVISDNKIRESIYFIENVSDTLKIDKQKIYINNEASIDGAIIKIDEQFYRVITGQSIDNYILEKMEIYKSNFELVEVNEK